MDKALLFKNKKLVNASEVEEGLISKEEEFIDIEENFKVVFVKRSIDNKKAHFRYLVSKDEYLKLSEDKKILYDFLVSSFKHKEEDEWYKSWIDKFSHFAKTNFYIKNEETNKHKFADVFIKENNLCIELEKNYIRNYFDEKNLFFSSLGYKTIWLFDLTNKEIKKIKNNYIEILEGKSKAFFNLMDETRSFKDFHVFIQTKDKMIYKVERLEENNSSNNSNINVNKSYSKIRRFKYMISFNEDSFIKAIKDNNKDLFIKESVYIGSIYDLWDDKYKAMVVENIFNNKETIIIYGDDNGYMYRDFKYFKISYKYVTFFKNSGKWFINSNKFYNLNEEKAKRKEWKLLGFKKRERK